MRLLQRSHEWAADRGWTQYPEPEWRRMKAARRRNWIDPVFKWGLFGWLMWLIWAPVLLGILIATVMVIGSFR